MLRLQPTCWCWCCCCLCLRMQKFWLDKHCHSIFFMPSLQIVLITDYPLFHGCSRSFITDFIPFLYDAIRSLLFRIPTISFSLRFLFDISIYATGTRTAAIVGQLKSVFIGTKWVAINFSDCNISKLLLYCFWNGNEAADRKILQSILLWPGK